MIKQPKKILACVDQSPYADYVADYSAWAAQRFSLLLELLHIIDRHQETATSEDHSGAIGFDAQENLLNRLTQLTVLIDRGFQTPLPSLESDCTFRV